MSVAGGSRVQHVSSATTPSRPGPLGRTKATRFFRSGKVSGWATRRGSSELKGGTWLAWRCSKRRPPPLGTRREAVRRAVRARARPWLHLDHQAERAFKRQKIQLLCLGAFRRWSRELRFHGAAYRDHGKRPFRGRSPCRRLHRAGGLGGGRSPGGPPRQDREPPARPVSRPGVRASAGPRDRHAVIDSVENAHGRPKEAGVELAHREVQRGSL